MNSIFFKTAYRNLWKYKGFTAINISGLALGIATCLLILLFVQHELSYDRYNEKADRMYRVVFRGTMPGGEIKEANVMPPVAHTMKNDFPEVQEATRIQPRGRLPILVNNKLFKENLFAFADSNFFQVFTIPLIKGDPKTALLQPNSIVLSKAVATQFFGNEDPIGKMITIKDNNVAMTVTGVIDKVPDNSHFHFDLFASMSSQPESREQSWMTSNFYTYIVLPEGFDPDRLQKKLPGLVEKYIGPQLKKAIGLTLAEFNRQGSTISFHLQRVTDIHLRSDLDVDMEPHGDIRYVYIFASVAVFMLLIACINFMNLSTASAAKRAKEVGIRKVVGSARGQLIRQFLLESLLLVAIAMILALAIVYFAMPLFNGLLEQNISLQLKPWVWPALIGFGLLTGILAGSYPAFYLSSFNPVTVLKGRFNSGKNNTGLRSGLVVFQFFICISLIIGTAIVYQQLSYIRHKKLGYDKEQVLVIHETYWLGKSQDVFRQKILQDPDVLSVTASGYVPAGASYGNNFMLYPDSKSSQLIKTLRYEVDEYYLSTLGIQLSSGRNFSREYGSDSTAIIVNETAARQFGWNNDAIGHRLTNSDNDGTQHNYHVIGIIKDFHFRSLHERITPLVMTLGTDYGTMIAKLKPGNISRTVGNIQKQWAGLTSESPFTYSFLDDRFNNTYKAEQNIGRILGLFAGLTIFVACMGLFGLATYTASQRVKEIGVRKVLGADVTGIVALLSRDFLKLVGIAFIIAAPVAWFVMNKWLQDFAYRIHINAWIFISAALLTIIITIITVSFQALKAALANPVKSLRSE